MVFLSLYILPVSSFISRADWREKEVSFLLTKALVKHEQEDCSTPAPCSWWDPHPTQLPHQPGHKELRLVQSASPWEEGWTPGKRNVLLAVGVHRTFLIERMQIRGK